MTASRLDALRRVVERSTPNQLHAFCLTISAEDRALVAEVVAELAGRLSYRDDPERFVLECIAWKPGEGPAPYQLRILRALRDHKRVAVRSLHGTGKTAVESWVLLWFSTTRDGEDWKAASTATVWRQLSKYLWPEVHKWASRLRWDRIGRTVPWLSKRELLDMAIKLDTGEAFAVASNDETKIEGAHADQLLYVLSEAKGIPAPTWDAVEGAFATIDEPRLGAAPDAVTVDVDGQIAEAARDGFALAMSTPGPPTGRFYDIHRRRPGLENWHTIHVTLDEAIAAGRVSRSWSDRMAQLWGVDSALYKNRVLGEFADVDEDSVIPLEWIEAANHRWLEWNDDENAAALVTAVGVDVARYGDDKTVLALRCGPVVARLNEYGKISTMATAGHCKALNRIWPKAVLVVDVIGVGAGVVDSLREWNAPVVAFNASERSPLRDRTGSFGFTNKRSAAWWTLRELLDPAYGSVLALPDDPVLIGDLTAPTWEVTSGGLIKIEPKDDIRARLGRSPDKGDAVVMSFVADSTAGDLFVPAPPSPTGETEPSALAINF